MYPFDEAPVDNSPEAVARRGRCAREAQEQRVRRLRAEAKALLDNRLVIHEVGVAASGTGAALYELRKRRNTSSCWIDVEDTLLGRPRRTGGDIPGAFRARYKRSLKRTAEAGRGGMALRTRTLPAPKKVGICGSGSDAPVSRISRTYAHGKNYQHTFFAGLTRTHATSFVKGVLEEMEAKVRAGQYDDASLERLERLLAQFEKEERS